MLTMSQDFARAHRAGRNQRPILLLWIINAAGARVYSDARPADAYLGIKAGPKADGSWRADGSVTAGADNLRVLEAAGRVKSWGRLREFLTIGGRVLAGLQLQEAAGLTVTLSNQPGASLADGRAVHPFSRMAAAEGLLGARVELMAGYPGLKLREFISRFSGQIEEAEIKPETIQIKAAA